MRLVAQIPQSRYRGKKRSEEQEKPLSKPLEAHPEVPPEVPLEARLQADTAGTKKPGLRKTLLAHPSHAAHELRLHQALREGDASIYFSFPFLTNCTVYALAFL